MSTSTETLLLTSLQVAVPLWIERVRQMTPDARMARAHEAVDVIASAGDTILHRVPGKTAQNYNVLAEAIAILSFSPGGVRVFGEHWEKHRCRLTRKTFSCDARRAAEKWGAPRCDPRARGRSRR